MKLSYFLHRAQDNHSVKARRGKKKYFLKVHVRSTRTRTISVGTTTMPVLECEVLEENFYSTNYQRVQELFLNSICILVHSFEYLTSLL